MRNPCSTLLTAHFRLDGHIYVNQLVKAITENNCTYVFFTPTEVSILRKLYFRQGGELMVLVIIFREICILTCELKNDLEKTRPKYSFAKCVKLLNHVMNKA